MGKYVIKYAVIYEEYDGAYGKLDNAWELVTEEYLDSEQEALEYIKELEEDN